MKSIDFKGKNSTFLSSHLRECGYRIGYQNGRQVALDMAGNSNEHINAQAQSIIDSFDLLSHAQSAALDEIDQMKQQQPWRPSPEDLQRLADARQYLADGQPANPAENTYPWLEDAAAATDRTLPEMAAYITDQHDSARQTERTRILTKKAVRDATTADDVSAILSEYKQEHAA